MELVKIVSRKIKNEGVLNTIKSIPRLNKYLKTRLAYKKLLKEDSIETRFTRIHGLNLWGSSESVSGGGSEIKYTESIRHGLIENISKYKINSIVDAPCGDFNWMRLVLCETNIKYYGVDIVHNVIDSNNKKYKSENINFGIKNILKNGLPDCDLLIVRDFLFHLSFADVSKFLKNVKTVNYKYMLTTTHIVSNEFKNKDIRTGDSRYINIFDKPFGFKKEKIIEIIRDYPEGSYEPKSMILIAKENVPVELS